MNNKIINGNNIELLKQFPDNHFDSIVTDPPYGLGKEPNAEKLMKDWIEKGYHEISGSGFMGKEWDAFVPQPIFWKEIFRVLKPGGHILSFFGTRTYDWGVMAMRFAGFEVRDCIQWLYGSGFPKSHNISKAIDKIGGESLDWFIDYILEIAEERGISKKELTMLFPSKNGNPTGWLWNKQNNQSITLEQYNKIKDYLKLPFDNIEEAEREVIGKSKAGLTKGNIANFSGETEFDITRPSTDQAKKWDGFGSALKPANEPIVLARKPLEKGLSIAENVLKWGTGAINIDGCRVGTNGEKINIGFSGKILDDNNGWNNNDVQRTPYDDSKGRFPANLILTHSNYQVMNLVGNIDIRILAEIIRYFYGYTKVSDLRQRKRGYTKQIKCGDEVLQSGVQESISKERFDTEQSSSNLSELSNAICSNERTLSKREEEILHTPLQRPSSETIEGRESNKVREETYGGIQKENWTDQDKEWNDIAKRKASELERRQDESSRICEHNDFNTTDGLAENCEENATKSNIHFGTQNSDGDGIKKTFIENGECSSHKRDKERQPSEEFSNRGQSESFQNTPKDRCGDGTITEGEPILEVLDFDVPTEWLRYFEYTGENLGCECVGTKKVKSHNPDNKNDNVGFNPSGDNLYGKGNGITNNVGYAENGEETIEDWRCHEDCPIKILDEQSGESKSQKSMRGEGGGGDKVQQLNYRENSLRGHSDKGGASRFFYIAKASKSERNKGLEGFEEKRASAYGYEIEKGFSGIRNPIKQNIHPTVKPIKLMQYLVRLVTPPNGIVLDPFCGSGTTGVACKLEEFDFVGLEQDPEYSKIAQARIDNYVEEEEQELRIIEKIEGQLSLF